KQKLDIVDVVGNYVTLKKSGRNYKGLCPFHSEDSPSFMVSQELQIFKCFGCGEAGDIFAFIEKIEGVDFPQALETLADKAGVKLEKRSYNSTLDAQKKVIYEINHLTTSYYNFLLTKHNIGKPGLTYLKERRKLTDQTIRDFKLGYAPEAWDELYKALTKRGYKAEQLVAAGVALPRNNSQGFIDKFRGRIIFPLTAIDGKVVGFTGRTITDREPKYLNTGETAVFEKSHVIYALDKAKVAIKKLGCIFVEGQMDVISAHQAGITNVVATSGTALTVSQLTIISRYTKDLTFCFDADSAGEAAAKRGIALAEKEGFNIKVAIITKEYKDIDEFIQKDLASAKQALSEPIPAYDFLMTTAVKRYDKRSAIGKKKILEELVADFSQVTNKVLLDHYIKKISEELDVSEEVVSELLSKKTSAQKVNFAERPTLAVVSGKLPKNSSEEYILALLFKAPIDSQNSLLYKLEQADFTDESLQQIFSSLKKQLKSTKQFNIQEFIATIDQNLQEQVKELYLWDLGNLPEEPKSFAQEIQATFARVRRDTIQRELKNINAQIKQAEKEQDAKLLKELTKKFKEYSENLNTPYAEKN
ncbi:MAG TPA: DNA primase, partial [Candidatus Saccharimonadales bacterium]|nr:DNA primase [Candidatus Saccharimonadales bacterium]